MEIKSKVQKNSQNANGQFWGWLFVLLSVATLAGNGSFRNIRVYDFLSPPAWGGRNYRSSGDHVDLPRSMVERHVLPGTSLYLVCIKSNELLSVERSLHLAVSWVMCPTPVRFGNDSEIGDADSVLACTYGPGPKFESAGCDPTAFQKVDEGGGTALWMRRDRADLLSAGHHERASPVSAFREITGMVPLLVVVVAGALAAGWTGALTGILLFSLGMAIPPLAGVRPSPLFVGVLSAICIGVVWMLRHRLKGESPACNDDQHHAFSTVVCLIFCMVAVSMVLTHTFMAPNGHGISGGKAKLFYVAAGIPEGFFTDPARSTLQPAYPPGFALLTLGCYGFAGACGEWMTQLLGCFFMIAALLFLCHRGVSPWASFWVLSIFLCLPVLQMATLFYAEPLMALFILVGWERVRKGQDDLIGWLLIGASGYFKNEGLVYFLATWIAMRLMFNSGSASVRTLLAGLALPAFWHIFCRIAGAQLYDYISFGQCDFFQSFCAAMHALKLVFLEPWNYGFVYPLFVIVLILPRYRHRREPLLVAGFCAILSGLMFVGIFALSSAPDFDWHLESSMMRLLWLPSLLLIRELLAEKT